MCSQGYCNCNVCIELTLFQMISLLQGKKVLLCFVYHLISHREKKVTLGKWKLWKKSQPSPLTDTVVVQKIETGIWWIRKILSDLCFALQTKLLKSVG